jgi:hypothetical protein
MALLGFAFSVFFLPEGFISIFRAHKAKSNFQYFASIDLYGLQNNDKDPYH